MRFGTKTSCVIARSFFIFCLFAQLLLGKTITYQEDLTTNFKNPERGPRDDVALSGTLRRIYFELGSYRTIDSLSRSVLDQVADECTTARNNGMKIIPRFRYMQNCNGGDAPLSRILIHIEQLGPVLRANADVIALVEAGFIGAWGEWHYSGCTGESADVNELNNTESQRQILFKLLSVLPKNRMVVLRYSKYKRAIFGKTPLGSDSAFSGSNRARVGAQNDCFRYDRTDRGTYLTDSIEAEKVYLSQDNRYVPQEGESCGSSSLSACDSAMKDLKRMHWDCIALYNVFKNQWSSGGCIEKILRTLGYRIVLKNAILPDSVRPGNNFSGSIDLVNVGWGKIYNPRGCELVFRNVATTSKIIVKLGNDPRRWCMTDSVVNVPICAPLPADMPEGDYLVYLHLPDTASRLYGRREYSIRLANTNVWDDSTGYNSLFHTVVVSKTAPSANFPMQRSFTAPGGIRYSRHGSSLEISIIVPAPDASPVTGELFTLSGSLIMRRTAKEKEPGRYTIHWSIPQGSPAVCFLRVKNNGRMLDCKLLRF